MSADGSDMTKARAVLQQLRSRLRAAIAKWSFRGSGYYWERRYQTGGSSGEGSYGELAEFKAVTINTFVERNQIGSVIEFGCGDGNQLQLARYPKYVGLDVSGVAIAQCQSAFAADRSKTFKLTRDYHGGRAELAISLDVIYHLVEESTFDGYMRALFGASDRFVVVYSSNSANLGADSPHVRHREFTAWVAANAPDWILAETILNRFPVGLRSSGTSFAHFFIFEKQPQR